MLPNYVTSYIMVSKKVVVNFLKLPFSIITFFLNFTNSIILKHHLCVSDNLKARAIINNIKNRALCSAMSFAKEAYFFLSQTISFTNVTRHMEKNGKQNQPTNFLPYPIYTPRDYDQQHVTCIGTF